MSSCLQLLQHADFVGSQHVSCQLAMSAADVGAWMEQPELCLVGGGRAAAAEAWDLGIMKPFSHPGSCLLLLGVRKKHLSCLDWEVSRLSKEVERVRRNRATKGFIAGNEYVPMFDCCCSVHVV